MRPPIHHEASLLVVSLIVLLGLSACNPATTSSTALSKPAPLLDPDLEDLKKQYVNPLGGMDGATRPKRLAELKSHFVVATDEFNKQTTYRHHAFSKFINGNGTTLAAEVLGTTTPAFNIDSQYVGENWIFQHSVTVKVGDTTRAVNSSRNKREVLHGGVCEAVFFWDAKAVLLADLIATAGDKPVRVRIAGDHRKDYTLRPVHQRAIIETLELWKLLGGNSASWNTEIKAD